VISLEIPVDPEPPEATEWLIEELSNPVYQAAQPTLFDRIAKSIADWFASLQFGQAQGPPAVGLAVIVGLIVVGIIVAFLIFGVPRLNRRSSVVGALFGDDDARTSTRMRLDAEAAAARGDFTAAVAEMFRAIARGLAERTIVSTTPGTTARGFAATASAAFPGSAARLIAAAVAFDDVRYLGRTANADGFANMAALEADLRVEKPLLEASRA
jgi:hypothetical protein